MTGGHHRQLAAACHRVTEVAFFCFVFVTGKRLAVVPTLGRLGKTQENIHELLKVAFLCEEELLKGQKIVFVFSVFLLPVLFF